MNKLGGEARELLERRLQENPFIGRLPEERELLSRWINGLLNSKEGVTLTANGVSSLVDVLIACYVRMNRLDSVLTFYSGEEK